MTIRQSKQHSGASPAFRPVGSQVSFPELEERVLAFWRESDVFRRSQHEGGGTGGRGEAPLHVLRRPSHGERPAGHPPRLRAGLQGRHPPLQDDAGLPHHPQGRVGHARPARGAGGGEGAGPVQQAGDRGLRHRPLQRALPRERDAPRQSVGRPDGPHRLLGGHEGRLRHLRQQLHRDGVVDPQAALGQGAGLRGDEGHAALPSLRHQPLLARGGPGLPGGYAGPVGLHQVQVRRCAHPRPRGDAAGAEGRTAPGRPRRCCSAPAGRSPSWRGRRRRGRCRATRVWQSTRSPSTCW